MQCIKYEAHCLNFYISESFLFEVITMGINSSWSIHSIHKQDRNKLVHCNEEGQKFLYLCILFVVAPGFQMVKQFVFAEIDL